MTTTEHLELEGIVCHCRKCGKVAGVIQWDIASVFQQVCNWVLFTPQLCAECWKEKYK